MIDKHTYHKWSPMYTDQVNHSDMYTQVYAHLEDIDTHSMCMFIHVHTVSLVGTYVRIPYVRI